MNDLVLAVVDALLKTEFSPYVMLILALCVFLSHTVQYLPVSITKKVPNWVMVIINILASKHGTEKANQTDLKGNPKGGKRG